MKRLLFVALLLIFNFTLKAQFPLTQNLASDSTLVRIGTNSKGAIRGSLIPSSYTDTTTANLGRIDDYAFAIIGTTSDGKTWMRNYLATGWVQLSGGTSPSGSFWNVGGNLLPVYPTPYARIGTLTPYGGAISFITNSIDRLVIPDGGIVRSSAAINKYLMQDTVTKIMYYGDATGSSYTFTNGLTESGGTVKLGGTITESTALNPDVNTRDLFFGNDTFFDEITFNAETSISLTSQGSAALFGGAGNFFVDTDSMQLSVPNSRLIIEPLAYTLSTTGKKIMLRDTASGLVQNIDPATMVRPLISLTTTGSSGAATYNSATGVFNIPQYSGDSIATTLIAYVDSLGSDVTGTVGNPAKPYATINAALLATASAAKRIIKVGPGTFASHTHAAYIKANTTIEGSGKPQFDNTITGSTYPLFTLTAPTKLVGGTIFQGVFEFPNVSNIHVRDIGVDVGSAFIGVGSAQEGFFMSSDTAGTSGTHTNQSGKLLRNNIICENISVLQKDTSSLVHAFLVENSFIPIIKNISTWGGFAGVVSKNVGAQISNINVTKTNASYYGIIIKQNTYAYSYNTLLDGFNIHNSSGLFLHNEDGSTTGMQNITVTNGFIFQSYASGITQLGDSLVGVNISNVNIINPATYGMSFPKIARSIISNNIVSAASSVGYIVSGSDVTLSGNKASGGFSYDYQLTGVGVCAPVLAYNNSGMSTGANRGFVYNSYVFGEGNYGTGRSGLINATTEICGVDSASSPIVACSTDSTLAGYTFTSFGAPTSGDLVQTGEVWTTNAGGAAFGHYGLGATTLGNAANGDVAIKYMDSSYVEGIIGFTDNATGITGYNVIDAGFWLDGASIFVINSGAPVDPSIAAVRCNWYKINRTGSAYTLQTSDDDGGSWTTVYTFPFTGTALNAVVVDIRGTDGIIHYPQINF